MDEVKIKGVYKHYKGDYYLVEDIATHSETLEKLVLYRALYGDGRLWARPYELFLSKFELQDIKSVVKRGETENEA